MILRLKGLIKLGRDHTPHEVYSSIAVRFPVMYVPVHFYVKTHVANLNAFLSSREPIQFEDSVRLGLSHAGKTSMCVTYKGLRFSTGSCCHLGLCHSDSHNSHGWGGPYIPHQHPKAQHSTQIPTNGQRQARLGCATSWE